MFNGTLAGLRSNNRLIHNEEWDLQQRASLMAKLVVAIRDIDQLRRVMSLILVNEL